MSVDKSTVSEPSVSDELHEKNTTVNPAATAAETKAAENKEAAKTTEEHQKDAKVVDTKLGTSPEEKAAERASVPEDRLENPKQNREPKNEFEKQNQKDTDAVRKAAQKESDVSTKTREEKSETPNETGKNDAAKTVEVNQGSDIAAAIVEGLKSSKEDKSIKITADENVEPRFSLVRNKQTGEVLVRENETRILSKVQLESLEEKEASLQDTEVEEL